MPQHLPPSKNSDHVREPVRQPYRQQGTTTAKSGLQPLGSLLLGFALDDKGGRISAEFQDYGYRLAVDLNDMDHKSLYIKLAKTVERSLLEQARSFVLDAQANSRAKLFMWKLSQLKKEKAAKLAPTLVTQQPSIFPKPDRTPPRKE